MKAVSVSELKASLDEHLRAAQGGEEIVVTDRGEPVARLVGVRGTSPRDERRARLARQGVLRLRKAPLRGLTPPPGETPSGVLAALLEERVGER